MGKALSGELSSMQIDLVLFVINLLLLNKIRGTEYQASCLKIISVALQLTMQRNF